MDIVITSIVSWPKNYILFASSEWPYSRYSIPNNFQDRATSNWNYLKISDFPSDSGVFRHFLTDWHWTDMNLSIRTFFDITGWNCTQLNDECLNSHRCLYRCYTLGEHCFLYTELNIRDIEWPDSIILCFCSCISAMETLFMVTEQRQTMLVRRGTVFTT